MKKFLNFLYWAVIIFMFAWIMISYIDIVSQNSMPNPQYLKFNLFELIFG